MNAVFKIAEEQHTRVVLSGDGQADEYSDNIVDKDGRKTTQFEDDAIHIRDLNATILHQLGIDHTRLTTFRFPGLDQKFTGVEATAHVVSRILS